MRIDMIIKQKESNEKYFSAIEDGEVFLWYDNYYMKTESTYCNDNGDYENAVMLSNGLFAYFDDKTKVIRVDCELVIK
jgi:hypothetical protein